MSGVTSVGESVTFTKILPDFISDDVKILAYSIFTEFSARYTVHLILIRLRTGDKTSFSLKLLHKSILFPV